MWLCHQFEIVTGQSLPGLCCDWCVGLDGRKLCIGRLVYRLAGQSFVLADWSTVWPVKALYRLTGLISCLISQCCVLADWSSDMFDRSKGWSRVCVD